MKKQIKFYYILISFMFPGLLYGQVNSILSDSTIKSGVIIIDGGEIMNSEFCQVKNGGGIINFTPNDLNEYILSDGRKYVAKNIQVSGKQKRVFLKQLVEGNATLFGYYGREGCHYFIAKDSTLFTELMEKPGETDEVNFREKLAGVTSDCQNALGASKRIHFNDKSLTRFVTIYNNCGKTYPKFRYGIMGGYGFTKLSYSQAGKEGDDPLGSFFNQNSSLKFIDFKYEGGYTFGLFIDSPIQMGDFSFHSELFWLHNDYSYTTYDSNKKYVFQAYTYSLNLPLLIRYTYPKEKTKPFIDAGINYSGIFRKSDVLTDITYDNSGTEITRQVLKDLISKNFLGLSMGCGLDYKITKSNYLFFELRLNKLFGLSGFDTLNRSEIQLFTGFSF